MLQLTLRFDGLEDYGARAARLPDAQIPVTVAVRRGDASTALVQAVLDTGATRCFFGSGLAQQVGIDLYDGHCEWQTGRAATGDFRFQVHPVVIELAGWRTARGDPLAYELDAAFCEWDGPRYSAKAILGLHGFFDRFCIAIDEQKQRLWWRYRP